MTLPKRLLAEKTTYLTSDDGVIPIDTLPEPIVQEFEVLDLMKKKLTDLRFEVEVIGHAIKSKSQEIGTLVQEHLSSNTLKAATTVPNEIEQ